MLVPLQNGAPDITFILFALDTSVLRQCAPAAATDADFDDGKTPN